MESHSPILVPKCHSMCWRLYGWANPFGWNNVILSPCRVSHLHQIYLYLKLILKLNLSILYFQSGFPYINECYHLYFCNYLIYLICFNVIEIIVMIFHEYPHHLYLQAKVVPIVTECPLTVNWYNQQIDETLRLKIYMALWPPGHNFHLLLKLTLVFG